MSEAQRPARPTEEQIAEEMARIPYEPLQPVEKKLIIYSLVLGIVLLGILMWLSSTFFPAGS